MSDLVQKIREAVARGWCSDGNTHKEMDAELAEAIVQEVRQSIARQPQERGEAVAWGVAGKDDGFIWTVAESKQQAERNAEQTGDDVIPLYAHPPAVDARVAELEARISDLELEAQLETCIREKLSEILTRTANVLKGEPDELTVHSWHDLAEIAGRRIAALDQQLAASREREGRMREALRHGRGIVPGGLWTSIELCAPNESPVKPGEYEDQYRFGWNACRAEVLRNMAALAAEKGEK